MENHQISKQELKTLLTQLRKLRVKYPPELLAARRRMYLGLAALVIATRTTSDTTKKQWISSILHEPGSTVIKILIAIFVAFLIAFLAHALVTGNVDFGWVMSLLSR